MARWGQSHTRSKEIEMGEESSRNKVLQVIQGERVFN